MLYTRWEVATVGPCEAERSSDRETGLHHCSWNALALPGAARFVVGDVELS